MPVGRIGIWPYVLAHGFLEKFERGLLGSGLCDKDLQHFPFMINCPSQAVHFAVDLHEHLIEVPSTPSGSLNLDPAFPDLGGEDQTEPLPPEPDRFVTGIDAAFARQILYVADREGNRM